MTGYDLLVAAHVAGAIGWVGGNTYLQIAGRRILNRHKADEMQGFVGDLAWLGPRWFIPVSLWTIIFGVAAAIDGPWGFGDPWISAGLTMFVISFLIGATYLGPQTEKLVVIGEEQGVDSPAYTEKIGKILFASRIELILLWVIVFMMVTKPG
jgi:hypothetical protein